MGVQAIISEGKETMIMTKLAATVRLTLSSFLDS